MLGKVDLIFFVLNKAFKQYRRLLQCLFCFSITSLEYMGYFNFPVLKVVFSQNIFSFTHLPVQGYTTSNDIDQNGLRNILVSITSHGSFQPY